MSHLTKDIIIMLCLFWLYAEVAGLSIGLHSSWLIVFIPGWLIYIAINAKQGNYKEDKGKAE